MGREGGRGWGFVAALWTADGGRGTGRGGEGYDGNVVATLWTAGGVFQVLGVNLLDAGHLPWTTLQFF